MFGQWLLKEYLVLYRIATLQIRTFVFSNFATSVTKIAAGHFFFYDI